MKVLAVVKYLLVAAAIVFLFINWKISIGLFLVGSILHAFPHGPNFLFSVITGYLIIGGIAFLFFDWRIGIFLIVAGFLVAKFRTWASIKNHEYYQDPESTTAYSNQEESKVSKLQGNDE